MAVEGLQVPRGEILKQQLDPAYSPVQVEPFHNYVLIDLPGGNVMRLNDIMPRPHELLTKRRNSLAIQNYRSSLPANSPLAQGIAMHYLTGEFGEMIEPVCQRLTKDHVSRNLRVVYTGDPEHEVVLAGDYLHLKEIEGRQVMVVDPPDPGKTYDQLRGPSLTYFSVNETTGEFSTEYDTEILGGYTPSAAAKKVRNTLTAPLFMPGVQTPEILMHGVLVDEAKNRTVSGIYAYRKPWTLRLEDALKIEETLLKKRPELAKQYPLSAQMLYRVMYEMRGMHTAQVQAEQLRALAGPDPNFTDCNGGAHLTLHTGNWGLVPRNLKGAEQSNIYVGDWETFYAGKHMRPEIMVMDAALTMLQPMLDSWKTLSQYEGGRDVFVNNFMYALLGLQRIDAAAFPDAYQDLLSKYSQVLGKDWVKAKGFDPQQILMVIWDVCKDIYDYDVLQAVRTGNAPYLQKAMEKAMANDVMPQMVQKVSGMLPSIRMPGAGDRDIEALLAKINSAPIAKQPSKPVTSKKKRHRH